MAVHPTIMCRGLFAKLDYWSRKAVAMQPRPTKPRMRTRHHMRCCFAEEDEIRRVGLGIGITWRIISLSSW